MGKLIAIAALLLVLGVIPTSLALILDWQPEGDSPGVWFQRSGSILVVFSVLADAILASLFTSLFPGSQTVVLTDDDAVSLKPLYTIVSIFAVVFTVVGTVIWGYGDLLL
ncbi:hypothetical protein [Saccharospirillum sp.]|uniref:hypothetical protein n=1 Tax=Saccharospirillum sp. TaxID=2033801 RepID=UPI0034A0940B